MAVRIRLKKLGRTHRPYYRVCAFDQHTPRDGRALEELGTYDTSLADTDARAVLKSDRIDYWLSVGAQPTEKVAVLIKKYGTSGTHLEKQKAALENLAVPKTIPEPGAPASLPKKEEEAKPPEAEAPTAEAPAAKVTAPAKEAAEAPADKPALEEAAPEAPVEQASSEEASTEEPSTEEKGPKSDE